MAKSPKTHYAILGALTVFPMSGYDIKKWVTDVTGPFWAESSGRIYPALEQLLRQKLVVCDATQGCGKRLRKVYKITTQGLETLQKWLITPAQPVVSRDELRLKIFYGKNLAPKVLLQHVKKQQAKMLEELERYKKIKAHIQSDHKHQKDARYWLLTLSSALHHCKAELNWCNEIMKILNSKF